MPDHAWPGEMILGKSGQWLGDFASEYVVPADSTRFHKRWPVGWTGATWFELTGCNTRWNGCACSDCHGTQAAFLAWQRYPGETHDPCNGGNFGGYDISQTITPQICADGCMNCIGPGFCSNYPHGNDSVQCGHQCGGQTRPAGWPLTAFGVTNAALDVAVVADASGPPGLEDLNAMRIDFSGVGADGATFIGEDGGYDAGRPPFTDSNPGGDYPADDWNYAPRHTTGITFLALEKYCFDVWVKAVPDQFGFTCVGWRFEVNFKVGFTVSAAVTNGSVTLDGTWQHIQGYHIIPMENWAPVHNAPMMLQTLNTTGEDEYEHCEIPDAISPVRGPGKVKPPRGRVHVKAVHLYSCSTQTGQKVHVWRWH